MFTPGIWKLNDLFKSCNEVSTSRDGKTWVPARPQIASGIPARFKAAWLVFTGKADAVVWPEGQ